MIVIRSETRFLGQILGWLAKYLPRNRVCSPPLRNSCYVSPKITEFPPQERLSFVTFIAPSIISVIIFK